MIRSRHLVAAALVAAGPALGAEGGAILGGEHVGFSRIVLPIEPSTAWSLETSAGHATVVFPGKALDFGTAGTFEKLPKTRIQAVRPTVTDDGTKVEVDIGCDCLVSALLVHTRFIAVDVADPGVVPEGVEAAAQHALGEQPQAEPVAESEPAEDQAAQEDDDAAAIASAEEILIAQIERAASQGLIELADTEELATELLTTESVELPEPEPADPGHAPAEHDTSNHAAPEHTPAAHDTPSHTAGHAPAEHVTPNHAAAEHAGPEAVEPAEAHAATPEPTEAPAPPKAHSVPAAAEDTPPAHAAPADTPPADEPTLPVRAPAHPETAVGLLARLADHEQIEATTVFDRDGRRAAGREAAPEPAPVCLPDAALDVGAWSNGLPLHTQAVTLSRGLVGEFDEPDPVALGDLVRLHIRFGFGLEAETLLATFDAPLEDRALLAGLARAVEGRPVAPDGPLAVEATCPGRHGLWLALGGVAPAFHDAEHFATVQAAFAELPPDFRALLGPALMNRLLDAGHPAEARLIYDTTARPGIDPSAELRLAEARLIAAEGHPIEAVQALDALVRGNAANAVDALTHLVRLALDANLDMPERVITDLRAAAVQYRGSSYEPALRRLLAEALARRADLAGAVEEIRGAQADLPAETGRFAALAARLLAEADPTRTGGAAYAETVLAAADLVSHAPRNDPARSAIGARLVDLGLPTAALALVEPAVARGDAAARGVAAQAHLRLGEPEAARAALGPLDGPEAAEIRARSFAQAGDYAQAAATLVEGDLEAKAAPYAWPAGDWPRAQEAAETPDRVAMAGYMAARDGLAAPPVPAADPTVLDPGQAFQEPLPPLQHPSLDAARRLLATGKQVEDMVQSLLAEDPASPPTN